MTSTRALRFDTVPVARHPFDGKGDQGGEPRDQLGLEIGLEHDGHRRGIERGGYGQHQGLPGTEGKREYGLGPLLLPLEGDLRRKVPPRQAPFQDLAYPTPQGDVRPGERLGGQSRQQGGDLAVQALNIRAKPLEHGFPQLR